MEGVRSQGLVALAMATCVAALFGGCEGGGAATERVTAHVETADPARTFAPEVHLHPRERRLPVGARWFISHSTLWFGDDQGCADRKVSVGPGLSVQPNEVVALTFLTGLGHGPAYWREAMLADCENAREAYRYYANQLTRPYDPSTERAAGLRAGEGYFLDLADRARDGQPTRPNDDQVTVRTPAYVEIRPREVAGENGWRLSYWLLFGMQEPVGPNGPVESLAHEGDWERVDVLLRGGDGDYEPVAARLRTTAGEWREYPWRSLRIAESGGEATHPMLFAARGSHTLHTQPGRVRSEERNEVGIGDAGAVREDVLARPCAQCPRWQTWRSLVEASREPWYGFGGAWGERGANVLTTGPLGPHGDAWPRGNARAQHRVGEVNRRLRRRG